jgi:multicomponent Na+:H+ antiporter subunit G
VNTIGQVLVLAGAVFALLAAVGVHRFPDVFTRMHSASKATSLGLVLVVAGTAVIVHPASGVTKLAVVAVFQLLTAPVAAHLVGRAAYRDPTVPPVIDTIDELAGAEPGESPET